jgi:hypothetical protein
MMTGDPRTSERQQTNLAHDPQVSLHSTWALHAAAGNLRLCNRHPKK